MTTPLHRSFRIFSLTPLPRLVPYRLLVLACPVVALAALGLGHLDRDLPWLADLATHWVWPAIGVSLAACLFGSVKERLLSVASWSLCAGLLAAAAPAGRNVTPAGVAVRLASANVLSTNTNYAAFENWVQLTQPGVITVLEVNAPWGAALEGLAGYPYRKIVVRDDNFGIALLSKFPMTAEVVTPSSLAHLFPPSISAMVSVPGAQPLKVIATHPVPPVSAEAHAARGVQLAYFGDEARAYAGPAVVMGDFNATAWSSVMLRLERRGLTRLTGLEPSWPATGLPWALISIDHLIANKGVLSGTTRIGPGIGSDHRPLEAVVRIPEKKQ